MGGTTKAERKEHYQLNRERILQQRKEHYELHRESILQQRKEYQQLNKESITQQKKEYRHTEEGNKIHRISRWKYQGMILRDGDDWESVYYYYMATDNCEQCNKVFQTALDKHLDHCHTSKFIRDVVCCRCNVIRGYEDNKSK